MGKDKEGDGYEFVPPDFDEDTFIHKEMVEFKTTVIRTVVAVAAAVVAWAAFLLLKGDDRMVWWAGLGVCAAFGLLLPPLFRRYSDVSKWKRFDWFGTATMYFLTWLALVTVAVNPPVADVSPPQVQVAAAPPVQSEGGSVTIHFMAVDNRRLDGDPTLTLLRDGVPVEVPPVSADGEHPGHYFTILSNPHTPPGRYAAQVAAADGEGRAAAAQANFTVQPGDVVKVTVPPGGNLTEAGAEEILVRLDTKPCAVPLALPCIRTVYFDPGAGREPVPFEYSDGKGGWFATAKFDRWQAGENTGHVAAEFLEQHQGTVRIDGGTVRSREAYTLRVQPAAERHAVSVMPHPGDPQVNVPAYGVAGVLAAVLGAAAVLRRRAWAGP